MNNTVDLTLSQAGKTWFVPGREVQCHDSSDWNHFGLHRIREKIAPNGIDVSACVGVTHSEPDIGLKTFYWLSYPGTRKLHTKTVCKSRYQLVLGFNACRNNSSVIRGSTETLRIAGNRPVWVLTSMNGELQTCRFRQPNRPSLP